MPYPVPSPKTFDAWLEAVVAPFPDDTAERLRAELSAHHAEALAALREAGHPDPEGAALAGLGPVPEVREALKHAYFTRLEDEALRSAPLWPVADPESPRRAALGTVLALALPPVAGMLGWLSFGWAAYSVYAVGLLLLGTLSRWVPRRVAPRSGRVLHRALKSLWHVLGAASLSPVWFGADPQGWVVVAGITAGVALAEAAALRPLWPYLPKALRGAR
ncbi:hypothetical protein [Deinococcus murrayi]|uniref:hypothetical protein n=1 Tax=Deinococcus murrayi TaxID=68910 RepID=UPI000486EE75|nr:hypothetical protein [Deinococcus murrayi]